MKKIKFFVMMILIVIMASFGLAACSGKKDEQTHTHNYVWVNNGDGTHKQHCIVDGCDKPDKNVGEHEYGESGKCVCGAIKPAEHKHFYTEQVAESKYLKTAATCKSKAVYYYSCVCGETGTETFEYGEFADHVYGDLIDEVPATCRKEGVKAHYHCDVCDKDFDTNKTELSSLTIAKADHIYGDLIAEVPATCQSEGIKAHYHCDVCGKDFDTNKTELSDLIIAKTKHSYTQQVAESKYLKTAATCTSKAVYYYSCVCGEIGAETFEYGELMEHTYGDLIAEVPATCENEGVKAHYHCNVCDKDFDTDRNELESLVIAKADHTYGDLIAEVPATCKREGVKAHYHCNVCGKNFDTNKNELSDLIIAKTEHSYTRQVAESKYLKTVATCKSKAVYYYSCVCGEAGTETFEYGEFADHTYGDLIAEVPATCRNEGVKAHYHCEVCGKDFDTDKAELASLTIAKADHTYGDWVEEIPATCTTSGTKGHKDCTICEKHFDKDNNEITDLTIKAAHTFEDGKCTVCGALQPTDGIIYTLSYNSYYYVSGVSDDVKNNVTNLVIADVYNGLPVTAIGRRAFKNYIGLVSVTIPGGVTSINNSAFFGCKGLTSINYTGTITDWINITGLKYLMGYGKSNKTLTIDGNEVTGELIIPDGITTVGNYAFYGCNGLTSVTIPDGVTFIGERAFYGCSGLTSVTLFDGITSIGDEAFKDCRGLTNVNYVGTITDWIKITGLGYLMSYGNWNKTLTIDGNEVTGELIIPDGVTSIGSYAFYECNGLTSVIIPNSVTSIGECTFASCGGLTSVELPTGIISIANSFMDCPGLTSVTIPDSLTSAGFMAFHGCQKLTNINYTGTIAEWVKISGINGLLNFDSTLLIDGKEITGELVIPAGVTSISDYAFKGRSGLTSVIIPNGVTSIGEGVFWGCSGLTSIKIPDSVISIGIGAFNNCAKLISVDIPDSVNSIGGSAFENCSGLININISDSVTIIDMNTFKGCSGLTTMTIPKSITNISSDSFLGCTNLKTVYYKGTEEEWKNISVWDSLLSGSAVTIYFYSETEPTTEGNYWHYVNGEIDVWKKDN